FQIVDSVFCYTSLLVLLCHVICTYSRPTSTALFPYTTLFRSDSEVLGKKSKKKEPVTEEITEVASNSNTHRVEQGDTLYNISKRYETTVDEIKRLNKLSGNDISIGQILRVK